MCLTQRVVARALLMLKYAFSLSWATDDAGRAARYFPFDRSSTPDATPASRMGV